MNKEHLYWMSKCIELAEKGRGFVSPNPLVGACVVKNKKLVASGYHAFYGGAHAEAMALKKAGKRAKGATLYISLEPCSTEGKTPPCTEQIIRSGIKKVIYGMTDPNPAHKNKARRILSRKKIKVESGVLSEMVEKQNESFVISQLKKRPFVLLKMAQSMDGKITGSRNNRENISSQEAKVWSHQLRKDCDAVLVGSDTVRIDNPKLTPYLIESHFIHNPTRVILDRTLSLKKNLKVFDTNSINFIFTSNKHSKKKIESYSKLRKVDVFTVTEKQGHLNLKQVLKTLHEFGIASLLVEGGGELSASLLNEKCVDKINFFIAPYFLGGRNTKTSVEGLGLSSSKQAIKLNNIKHYKVGQDTLIEAYL